MRLLFSALILVLVTGDPATAQSSSGPVQQLGWLTGCWRSERTGNRIVEEQWMAPRARTMLGMGRTVRDTVVVEFEHTQILERNARVEGTTPQSSPRSVVFSYARVSCEAR